ncbi:MAG TPA: peptidylprolyl isomerase [Thermoanaerobaculia bacterium]|nr:peptidylprolyl isomerase [Thermoanaerobaculia bacterium]
MKKTLLALFVAAVATTAGAAQLLEAIVVRVGDRIITRTQYLKRINEGYNEIEQTAPKAEWATRKADFKKNLIDELVAELLVKDRADRLNITVTSEEVKESVARVKQQYGIKSDQEFDESLQKSNMNRAEMESRMRDSILSNKLFARELRPREDLTDKELRERYDREKERYRLPERAHLREIIVLRPDNLMQASVARQHAEDLAKQARDGADFALLAKTASEAATKDKGGDLGEVARGELLPELDKAVFNATAGQVIGPIEAKTAWHILKVEQRLPSEVPAFETLKEKLRKDVSEEAFQRDYKAYIDRLRKDAFIQINDANVPTT